VISCCLGTVDFDGTRGFEAINRMGYRIGSHDVELFRD
jgi:hypothetical protein